MNEIRLARLQKLLDERFDGVQTAAATALGMSTSYLNDLVRGRTPMGERTARNMEKALGLEPGWMDRARGSAKPAEVLEVVVNGKVALELPPGSAVTLRLRRR